MAVKQGYSYDLALLDMQLPDMTAETLGKFMARELEHLNRSEAIAKTQLILMTSLERNQKYSEWHQMGFASYLIKPLKKSRLQNS